MNYSQKLKDPRWQKRRLEVLQRDKFSCRSCRDNRTELQIHHLKYHGEPWEVEDSSLITLCKHCHSVIESYKHITFSITSESFKITRDDVVLIIIPQDNDTLHFFKIQFGTPEYFLSMGASILKNTVHHVIDWWIRNDREENLNEYSYAKNQGRILLQP